MPLNLLPQPLFDTSSDVSIGEGKVATDEFARFPDRAVGSPGISGGKTTTGIGGAL